jgi:hypothetical protein
MSPALMSLFVPNALATTWPTPPTALREQVAAATNVGEFEVVLVRTVVLEDGFPTTHVELAPVLNLRGTFTTGTLILPGGVVEGEFRRGVPDAFAVHADDTLFLMVDPVPDRAGYYNVVHGFHIGVFRKMDTANGPQLADSTGRPIVELSCSGNAVRQVDLDALAEREAHEPDTNEAGDPVLPNEEVRPGLAWDDAILTLSSCGSAE